jgi:hypothetical protein
MIGVAELIYELLARVVVALVGRSRGGPKDEQETCRPPQAPGGRGTTG